VGSIVTYSWEVYRNGNFLRSGDGDEMMQVEDSKIVYWENQHRCLPSVLDRLCQLHPLTSSPALSE
jgi:hypothetical protein